MPSWADGLHGTEPTSAYGDGRKFPRSNKKPFFAQEWTREGFPRRYVNYLL